MLVLKYVKNLRYFILTTYYIFNKLWSVTPYGSNCLKDVHFSMLYNLFNACICCTVNPTSATTIPKITKFFKYLQAQFSDLADCLVLITLSFVIFNFKSAFCTFLEVLFSIFMEYLKHYYHS